jgi:hypothetical protein
MRTRHRVAGVLAIAVLALAAPASAQLPPGMTAPTSPAPVSPGAAPAPGSGNVGADPVVRQGPFVGVGLDVGPQSALVGDVQVGWMIAPWVGVFVSLSGLLVDDGAAHLRGAGLRLASGAAFAEARILSIGSFDRECDDDPCGDSTKHIVLLGAGVEFVHSQHVALDLHLHVLTDGRDSVPLAGLGLSFHF